MVNAVFGDLSFSVGWKTQTVISFYGKEIRITVKAKAYTEKDGVSAAQEEAYAAFCKSQDELLKEAEKLLDDYAAAPGGERFSAKRLLINRDGSYALIVDDTEDPDGGLAVTFAPTLQIVAQDKYL